MLFVNVNCKYFELNFIGNRQLARCSNKKVKRSCFGIGPRFCMEWPCSKKDCQFKELIPPPPPAKRIIREDVWSK